MSTNSVIATPMNEFGFRMLAVCQRGLRASALLLSCWLAMSNLSAAPCSRTSAQRDAWVAARINSLVRAAHAAYQNDKAQRAYERVLDETAGTMKQCRLVEDRDFVNRYPEFVEYLKVLSLSRQNDHQLGFGVPDRLYFAETRAYVTIPDFLLAPRFLRAVGRFETLKQAKALLRQLNAGVL